MEPTSLRQKVIAVLTQRGEALSYRELTDALWDVFPDFKKHMFDKYEVEKKARTEMRIRLGMIVKDHPAVFTATKSDGIVLVGLAATEQDVIEEADEIDEDEDVSTDGEAQPSVYWYTFPAYRKDRGAFPIKVGRGINALARISQQVTAMPESPEILGTYAHPDVHNLERALHAVLTLRGKRKKDAPGAEWFITTPEEISLLIKVVLGE